MSDVTQALQSDNGWFIAILIIVIILLLILGARAGLLKIRTDKILVGRDAGETENAIIRSQMQWARIAIQAFGNNIEVSTKVDKLRLDCCVEKAINMFVEWIILNHMDDNKEYVEVRQEAIWNLLNIYASKEDLRTPKFKKEVYSTVEYIIINLIRIRKSMQK
jgi:hypothetical protein